MSLLFALAFAFPLLYAQTTDFASGENLLKQNRTEEAIPYLQKAIQKGESTRAYEYLSLCYFQLGKYSEGVDVVNSAMKVPGTDKKVLALNAGNAAFVSGNFEDADSWYSVSITASPNYSAPVLNRANARVYLGKYDDAKKDYQKFLQLEPNDSRRPDIERMMASLDEEIAMEEIRRAEEQAEQERIAEEELRIAEELARAQAAQKAEEERLAREARLAEERRIQEEADRKRKLLEEVAASLQDSETTNMSAGAGEIIDYGYETELE